MKLIDFIVVTAVLSIISGTLYSQQTDANIFGDVKSNGEHLPYVRVFLENTSFGTTTDKSGHYMLTNLPEGKHVVVAKKLGYTTSIDTVELIKGKTLEINFVLEESKITTDQIVVTGTRTAQKITDSPVMVNIMDGSTLDMLQACNLSEGIRYQPGLRVETDCQTCNYTQLRMNGLGGSYSQILINGRQIFSPMIGLYGMEQIPSNMIDRIEIVRGGASALYGSSAIGGTVNIITAMPEESSYDFGITSQSINGTGSDNILEGNISMVNDERDAGAALFINNRNRDAYDHNGDNFSELPAIQNNSFGANIFYKPSDEQKIEISFSSLYEYRYGGEIIDGEPYQALQSEERVHNILMSAIDYQIDFNNNKSSLVTYLAGQKTDRDHYTGIIPDKPDEIAAHYQNPPYGFTENSTYQGGIQLNHRIDKFIVGGNTISLGAEYLYDNVLDSIPAYMYKIDQITKNFGAFLQADWQMHKDITFLAGVRMDKHNFIDNMLFSPRLSLLYKLYETTQLRATWGTGFRAPQAFDTDMHIAFAGGGVSRISLSPDLKEERSNSFSGSINFDKATSHYIFGFTIEAFYTKLNDAFYLHNIGEDNFGMLFEKRNGSAAVVQGVTLEARANYDMMLQFEAGYTLQSSEYETPVTYIEGLPAKSEFLRTPSNYG